MAVSPPPDRRDDADGAPPRRWLSALADGERDALPHAATLWREDADARECWHLYHLIGDVMRSDELASAPARDAAFLAGLRGRLAGEHVPLAPAPLRATRPFVQRLGWRAPAAVAAGFIAVAATLVLMRPEAPGGAGPSLAAAGGRQGVAGSTAGDGVRVVSNPAGGPAEGRMMRDARLDAYLRAHQSARGGEPAVLPGGGMRNVEIIVAPLPQALPPSAAASR